MAFAMKGGGGAFVGHFGILKKNCLKTWLLKHVLHIFCMRVPLGKIMTFFQIYRPINNPLPRVWSLHCNYNGEISQKFDLVILEGPIDLRTTRRLRSKSKKNVLVQLSFQPWKHYCRKILQSSGQMSSSSTSSPLKATSCSLLCVPSSGQSAIVDVAWCHLLCCDINSQF